MKFLICVFPFYDVTVSIVGKQLLPSSDEVSHICLSVLLCNSVNLREVITALKR